jgi:hypothetical protein
MSPIYVPGKVVLRQEYIGTDDPDAAVYIAAVEAADEAASPGVGALETGVKVAIHSFVKGCKADGIWPALKASCILAGARTLDGCLVPLVGSAPTNPGNVFVAGDYNRETGLKGNGSTKYLDSNRANNADPQNSAHRSVYASTGGSISGMQFYGSDGTATVGGDNLYNFNGNLAGANRGTGSGASFTIGSQATTSGFKGVSRSLSTGFTVRTGGSNTTATAISSTPTSEKIAIFARTPSSPTFFSDARLAFYSIGESLDLALLDARVTALIAAIGAAIP